MPHSTGPQQSCSGSGGADHDHLFSATENDVWGGSRSLLLRTKQLHSSYFSLMRKDTEAECHKNSTAERQSVERSVPRASYKSEAARRIAKL